MLGNKKIRLLSPIGLYTWGVYTPEGSTLLEPGSSRSAILAGFSHLSLGINLFWIVTQVSQGKPFGRSTSHERRFAMSLRILCSIHRLPPLRISSLRNRKINSVAGSLVSSLCVLGASSCTASSCDQRVGRLKVRSSSWSPITQNRTLEPLSAWLISRDGLLLITDTQPHTRHVH